MDSNQPRPQAPEAAEVRLQPMGMVVDPQTGQMFYTVPVAPFQQMQPQAQQAQSQQVAAQPPHSTPLNPPDYSALVKSVEAFAEGGAGVGDVIKTLYANTAQDDQFWKGAIVGAAATVLLTSDTVRAAMGGTLGSLFGSAQTDEKPQTDGKTNNIQKEK